MRIYIPVGIIASGKTTACRKWVEENQPAVHIEADDFRTIFSKKYTYDQATESIIWNLTMESAEGWLRFGYNVAVDDAVFFLGCRNRQNFEDNVRRHLRFPSDLDFMWDFIPNPTDEEVAERRGRESRGYTVEEWVAVARRQRGELKRD